MDARPPLINTSVTFTLLPALTVRVVPLVVPSSVAPVDPRRFSFLPITKLPEHVPVITRVSPGAAAVMAALRSSVGQLTTVVAAYAGDAENCHEAGHECERRYQRAGARPRPRSDRS